MQPLRLPPAPYPGLRAFRPEEAAIFCGRAEHRAELLDILAAARFLAVVGASGSGKSSLVLAGLLPDIKGGQLIGVEPETVRILTLQPGLRPFAHLAGELARALTKEIEIEAALRRGPLGLVQLLDEVDNKPDQALVVVVDQFEEIFRFADLSEEDLRREERSSADWPLLDGTQNEAQAFVNLLLATARQTRHSVYVLLTMRSDFLARCDQFTGLPEAISGSQFLTPRLNRQQLEQAITRPVRPYEAAVQPEVVNLILNQISTEQDQLPLMQHALARMWENKKKPSGAGPLILTLDDYSEVGGLASALNNHANSLCDELQKTAGIPLQSIERFFRSLAHHVSANIPPVRRPARLSQIASESGLPIATVRTIADTFRAEGSHLLMPPVNRVPHLQDETFLDISHESLLRQWQRLKEWMDAEWQQRRMAEELAAAMIEWEKVRPDESKGPISRFRSWKLAGEAVSTRLYREAAPILFSSKSPATLPQWARRYGIEWSRLAAFWKGADWWKKATAVTSRAGIGLSFLTLLLIFAVIFAFKQRAEANRERAEADREREFALRERAEAELQRQYAVEAAKRAEQNLQNAVDDRVKLNSDFQKQNQILTEVVTVVARSARGVAEVNTLLEKPEIRPLIPADKQPDVTPDPKAQIAVAGSAAPVQFSMSSRVPRKNPVVAFAWKDRDVRLVAGALDLPTTFAWKLTTAEPQSEPLLFESPALVSAPDGGSIVSFAGDKKLRLITASGATSISADCGSLVTAARIVQQSPLRILFGTAMGQIGVWDGGNGAVPLVFDTKNKGVVNAVDYSPEQNAVLASGDQGWARLWWLPPSREWSEFLKAPISVNDFREKPPIRGATFSPNGRLFVMRIGAAPTKIFGTTEKGRSVSLQHQGPILQAKFSPDGEMLASADDAGRVYLWDLRYSLTKMPPPVVLPGRSAPLNVLLWSPKGDFLLSAGDDGVPLVWQQPAGRLKREFNELPFLLPAHPGGVTGAAISPDGRLIATVGADSVVRVFPIRPTWRGTTQEWGGPKDSPYSGGEDLALLDANDVDSPDFRSYFLPASEGTKGLVSRLNPESFYITARWDYSFTPRSTLRSTKVRLRKLDAQGNPVGPTIEAQPVDWGPPASTGRAFDLSPGARRALGVGDSDTVEMEIPLLAPTKPASRADQPQQSTQ